MLTVTRGGRHDERGSLVITFGVLMVLTFLSMAVLARTLGSLTNVRRTQDFTAALASADGGLAEALFQIDQRRTTSFTGSGALGGGAYEYRATRLAVNTWVVRAKGSVNGVPHAIEATVQRDVAYPYAIFTEQPLTLNGEGGFAISSYNSSSGVVDTGNAVLGSNHALTINGGGGGDAQHYYTPNGSCSGCDNATQQVGPRVNADPVAPISFQACPAGGVFGTVVGGDLVIDGANGLAYKCTQDITFTPGLISVINGPVIVWVGANYSVTMVDAHINTARGASGRNFRLLKAGTGALNLGTGANTGSLFGVLYAPRTDLVVDGGQMNLDGSLTLNSFIVNGTPNFELRYDDTISTITSRDWKVSNWNEIPSTEYDALAT